MKRHVAVLAGIASLLALGTIYPFLPGRYDSLAIPLSTMTQVFGVVGLALVPCGVLWFLMPKHGFAFAVLTTIVATGIALILALFATLSVGNAFGVLTLGAWICALAVIIPRLRRMKRTESRGRHAAPMYLVLLPVCAFVIQLAVATSMTRQSRDVAIANATAFIDDIEQYYQGHGHYPVALQAQNIDYRPGVIGVQRYYYVPQGDSYNLSFEQPRFVLDRFGTREWVVYNPRDSHRVFSHVAWMLPPPEVVESSQGWYAFGETGRAHWRYFLFD